LSEEGPLDRDLLRERVAAEGIGTKGQAFVHLLALASIRGLIVRGPILRDKHAFVLTHDWLGEFPAVNRDLALAELARRYLAGHAPASDKDLARWAGLPVRDAREGLNAIASELHHRDDGMVVLKRQGPATPHPAPKLLGSFEPVLLGWSSRDLILGDAEPLVVSGGVFRQFVLVRGRAAGAWTISKPAVTFEAFGPLTHAERTALETEATDVARFLAA
jgi:Winged helix DNA-binding domain